MILDVTFQELNSEFKADFGQIYNISDGGYERGYAKGYDDGYSKGETAGYAAGYEDGMEMGYAHGKTDGHSEGYALGYAKGFEDGYAAGYDAGYAAGYEDGKIPPVEKDVNFWDYDGTLLHSYTLSEVQEMTELPPLPTHARLICQGWNWSLERLKAQGYADVGAVYITDDGKTRLIVEITDMIAPMIYLNWRGATVNIDWGDDSDVETSVAAGSHSHEYTSIGEYEITLEVVSGALAFGGSSSTLPFVGNEKTAERGKAKRIHFGSGLAARFQGYGFSNMINLEKITVPEGVGHIGASEFLACRMLRFFVFPKSVITTEAVFNQCSSLFGVSLPEGVTVLGRLFQACAAIKRVCVPDVVTSIAASFLAGAHNVKDVRITCALTGVPVQFMENCYRLPKVELPNSVTTIGSSAFYNCYSFVSFKVPSGMQSIGSSAFGNCNSLVKLAFLPTTPPTVANANAFNGIPTTCIVEVHAESLELYQNATNYGTIAAQMVGV